MLARYLRTRSPPETTPQISEFDRSTALVFYLADRRPEPGPRIRPHPIGRPRGDSESGGRVGDAHPGEVAELDQLGGLRVSRGQPAEGVIDGQDLGFPATVGSGDGVLGEIELGGPAASLEGGAAAGAIDQNVPHGL